MTGVRFVVVLGLALWGCSSSDGASSSARRAGATQGAQEPRGEPMPHETCVAGTGAQTMDVNNDGQPDIRTMMEAGRPRCREVDANFDGRVDIIRWYDASGAVTRVEDDYDFDGRMDVVASYEGGVVVRDILDTNFDGVTDTWRDYRNGRVTELRRDADGDARVDTWERFDGEGRLTFAAVDANHDGLPDAPTDGDGGARPAAGNSTTNTMTANDAGAPVTPAPTPTAATPADGGA